MSSSPTSTFESLPGPQRPQQPGFPHDSLRFAFCPCIQAAQVSSSVGGGYKLMLAWFTTLYVAAFACYVVGMSGEEPPIRWKSLGEPILIAWVLLLFGPLATIGMALLTAFVVLFSSEIGPALTDTEIEPPYIVDGSKYMMLGLHAVLQLVLSATAMALRDGMNTRAGIAPRHLFTCCCPLASIEEMTTFAKQKTGTPGRSVGPIDELPAFSEA